MAVDSLRKLPSVGAVWWRWIGRRWWCVTVASHRICIVIARRSAGVLVEESTAIISVLLRGSRIAKSTVAEEAAKAAAAAWSAASTAIAQSRTDELSDVARKHIRQAGEEAIDGAARRRSLCCVASRRSGERGSAESRVIAIAIAIITSTSTVRGICRIIERRLGRPWTSSGGRRCCTTGGGCCCCWHSVFYGGRSAPYICVGIWRWRRRIGWTFLYRAVLGFYFAEGEKGLKPQR